MHRLILSFAILLCSSSAFAQRALLVEMPNGSYIGIAFGADGSVIPITQVQIIKAPTVEPPAPKTTGTVSALVFRVASKLTIDQNTALLDLHTWANEQTGVQVIEYEPGAVNSDGTPNETAKSYQDVIPTGSKYPYAFIVQKAADSGKAVILWQGEFGDPAPIIERLKSAIQNKAPPKDSPVQSRLSSDEREALMAILLQHLQDRSHGN